MRFFWFATYNNYIILIVPFGMKPISETRQTRKIENDGKHLHAVKGKGKPWKKIIERENMYKVREVVGYRPIN